MRIGKQIIKEGHEIQEEEEKALERMHKVVKDAHVIADGIIVCVLLNVI